VHPWAFAQGPQSPRRGGAKTIDIARDGSPRSLTHDERRTYVYLEACPALPMSREEIERYWTRPQAALVCSLGWLTGLEGRQARPPGPRTLPMNPEP
jgi:hypothetical protein